MEARCFFSTTKKASLSDVNQWLITTYQTIRDNVDALIAALEKHQIAHSKCYYSRARELLSMQKDPLEVAALFIYLNKTCYNGLYRVNQSGKFNVPIGSYRNPAILDEDNLRKVSKVLQNVAIHNHPFQSTPIHKGAFYYFDPPYHKTYSGYAENGFGEFEHEKLATFCKQIDKAGAYFMLSNSDTKFCKELYKHFNTETIQASRFVSCKGTQRGKQVELLIRNYE